MKTPAAAGFILGERSEPGMGRRITAVFVLIIGIICLSFYAAGKPFGARLFGNWGDSGRVPAVANDRGIFRPAREIPDYRALKSEIEDYIGAKPATYGIYFKDLKSGASFGINEREPITAASTVKVPVVLYLNHLVAEGNADWTDRVVYNSATDYQDGAGILQFSARDGDRYSLRVLANLAITISDNVANRMLMRHLGKENIAEFMRSLGGETVFPDGANITTARDMGMYMEAVLKFRDANPILGGRLLDDMANPIYHVGLPGELPDRLMVAHKEGDVWGVANDVGIVFAPRPYILVVLSKDVNDIDEGFRDIARISKIVYDYQANIR